MPSRIRHLAFGCLVIVIFGLLVLPARAAVFPDPDWPTSTPEAQGISSERLAKVIELIDRRSVHIDSLAIVRHGRLVLDAYFWPFAKGQRHRIHSCTKSVMSALIGIAIDQGYIKGVDQPIKDFFPAQAFAKLDEAKQRLTLKDILMMAAGLDCRDSYRYLWQGLREMRSSSDWAQYVLDRPLIAPPGQKFEYCNGLSYLLSVILQNQTKIKAFDFARKNLFGPLGITDVLWTTSPQGYNVGYGQMWLQPLDMARFGWLYLNQGRWGDKQVVSPAWVAASTSPRIEATWNLHYGYQWWVEEAKGYYTALGYKGQLIVVVPKKDMVIVMTSDLPGGEIIVSKKLIDSYLIPAAENDAPLPPNPQAAARLAALTTRIASPPAKGFIWISEEEGVAKDGRFVRTASPSFRFEYPQPSRKRNLNRPGLGQIMRFKAPGDVDLAAYVVDIPPGLELKDVGPKLYGAELAKIGTNIRVDSNQELTLGDGSTAYRTDFRWRYGKASMISYVISAFKDGKCIAISTNSVTPHYLFEPIVESFRLK